jgi:hypothetical protein
VAAIAPTLARVRRICLAFPETNERPSHGSPCFFIRDKTTFVMFLNDHHGDGRLALWCAAAAGAQEAHIARGPRFFRPPYVGHRGWIGVRLDLQPVDWADVGAIVEEAYRAVAPRALLAKLG